jgi:hypothetical protein
LVRRIQREELQRNGWRGYGRGTETMEYKDRYEHIYIEVKTIVGQQRICAGQG